MECLFCGNGKCFTTVEHIIPESMGNDDLVLTKEVCDKCQNYLSQIENYVLNKTPIGFWRTLLTIRNKKGKLASVNFTKLDNSKIFPDFHRDHDNVSFRSHPDFTTEIIHPKFRNPDEHGKLTYVITPKVILEIGRFLGKIAIELICLADRDNARETEFNSLRKYVREGSMNELWPLFHSTKGEIRDLFTYTQSEIGLKEDVECYSYSINQVGPYKVFNLKVGTDSWSICLNQQFPHPSLTFQLGENVKAIWYSKDQFRK